MFKIQFDPNPKRRWIKEISISHWFLIGLASLIGLIANLFR